MRNGNVQVHMENHTVYYSGNENYTNRVAIDTETELAQNLTTVLAVNDRFLLIKWKNRHQIFAFIQEYTSTSLAAENNIDTNYEQLRYDQ